jgi:hypothetical protein
MEEKKLTLEDFYPSEDTITLHLTMEWLLKSQKGETKKSMKKFVSDPKERERVATKIATAQMFKLAFSQSITMLKVMHERKKLNKINVEKILNKIQLN